MQTIVVEPHGNAWSVCVAGTEPQLYSSGAKAEETAKRIALRLASIGEQVELHVMLRGGYHGARFVCLPPLSDNEEPLLVRRPGINHVHDQGLVTA